MLANHGREEELWDSLDLIRPVGCVLWNPGKNVGTEHACQNFDIVRRDPVTEQDKRRLRIAAASRQDQPIDIRLSVSSDAKCAPVEPAVGMHGEESETYRTGYWDRARLIPMSLAKLTIDRLNQLPRRDSNFRLDRIPDRCHRGQMIRSFDMHWHWQAIDRNRNIARDYSLVVSTDLFGWTIVQKRWGRIGGKARVQSLAFATRDEAAQAVKEIKARRATAKQRIGTGYALVSSG